MKWMLMVNREMDMFGGVGKVTFCVDGLRNLGRITESEEGPDVAELVSLSVYFR
jgi:hypothetical protein